MSLDQNNDLTYVSWWSPAELLNLANVVIVGLDYDLSLAFDLKFKK